MAFLGALDLRGIDIAQSADVVTELHDLADVALDLTAHADEADLELARGLTAQQAGGQDERGGCGGGGVQKRTAAGGGGGMHGGWVGNQ